MTLALITAATAGLGRALALAFAALGHDLILDGRDPQRLQALRTALPAAEVVPGDVTTPDHRQRLRAAVGERALDLLIHNASTLGPSPLPRLAELSPTDLRHVLETNVVAPAALTALLLPALRRARGTVLAITSDAAVEHYPCWGAYGAAKAALDHLTSTLAVEEPSLTVYAVDPGDMRTAMHQAAFPGEDISDRPLPEDAAVPGLIGLLRAAPSSGRYRAADFHAEART